MNALNVNEEKITFLKVSGKKISIPDSRLLFKENFETEEMNPEDWIKIGNAHWSVKDGVLEGKWQAGSQLQHSQLFSRKTFQGDILMEFEAQTVLPSNHDIIWWWGVKLNQEKTHWEHGYLGGLGGWWDNKTGLERIDGDKACMVMTSLFKFEAGKKYKIRTGMIDGLAFLFINNRLIIEFVDPKPLAKESPGHIGFGVYQSHIRISNLKVYKPEWKKQEISYK